MHTIGIQSALGIIEKQQLRFYGTLNSAADTTHPVILNERNQIQACARVPMYITDGVIYDESYNPVWLIVKRS